MGTLHPALGEAAGRRLDISGFGCEHVTNPDTRRQRRGEGDMRINFKTVDRKTFSLDVAERDSVADLKTRLEDDLGKENMFRLIYSGKILRDDDCLARYDIDPKRFVVVMVTKGRLVGAKETVTEDREKVEEEKAKIVKLKKKLGDLKIQLEQEQNKEV